MGKADTKTAQGPAPRKMRGGWFALSRDGQYTLARQWPPKFDFGAVSDFPPVDAAKLALQIRQDLWRKLQGLRGFSPVVVVSATEAGLNVRAGGRIIGRLPNETGALVQELLDDPALRARWIRWAGVRR